MNRIFGKLVPQTGGAGGALCPAQRLRVPPQQARKGEEARASRKGAERSQSSLLSGEYVRINVKT